MRTRHIATIAAAAALLLASCTSATDAEPTGPTKAVTADSARLDLVEASLASVCSQEDYVICTTMDGSGRYAVMVMGQAELDETFTRLCTALVGDGSSQNPAVDKIEIVTDRTSFLVVGEIGLAFPPAITPQDVQQVLGGEVTKLADLC
ncbi:MAG: hypothetical protein IPO93_13065 [Actinobacteria bacterium]|nr:hypothetical protein [Actinomycetota bacterium]